MESLENFNSPVSDSRVIVMDCFGRRKVVQKMGQNYEEIEFGMIAADQKGMAHTPMGALPLGEISSMEGPYVELHNKTIVVATMEDG